MPAREKKLTIEFWHFKQVLNPKGEYPNLQTLHKGPM